MTNPCSPEPVFASGYEPCYTRARQRPALAAHGPADVGHRVDTQRVRLAHGSADAMTLTLDATHGLRCSCEACLGHRALIRLEALAGLRMPDAVTPDGAWAERSWDGPIANFPGTSHRDNIGGSGRGISRPALADPLDETVSAMRI